MFVNKMIVRNGRLFECVECVEVAKKCLGTFDTDTEAAHAYDQAILKYNHSTDKLNFLPFGWV